MKALLRAAVPALTLAVSSLLAAPDPGVTFIGRGLIAGNLLDKSGMSNKSICPIDIGLACIDQATLGGFGSALTYTGFDNVFLATPDRGPFDGRTNVRYYDRFHFLRITTDTSIKPSSGELNISTTLLDTRFLKNEAGANLVGTSSEFNVVNPLATLRFDPEGVAISRDGTFFVSDEYGPYIFEFNSSGKLIRRIPVPAKFLIANPTGQIDSAANSFELYPVSANPPGGGNDSGRQANRGMEGLAISPDGRYLFGMMQNALIQDNGLNSNTPPGRKGLNNRLLKYDLWTGQTWEFVYTMDAINQGRGVNDLLAVNDHQLLALERDNRSLLPTPPNDAQSPNLKRIYLIDLNKPGLTDVSGIASLPELGTQLSAAGIVPVTKTLFIDLLNSSYEVDSTVTPHKTIKDVIAEKMEGLAWGPKMHDGRMVLYVMSDNDLYTGRPTQVYAFAIDGSLDGAHVQYEPQDIPGPIFKEKEDAPYDPCAGLNAFDAWVCRAYQSIFEGSGMYEPVLSTVSDPAESVLNSPPLGPTGPVE